MNMPNTQATSHEEPEITQEESVPLDGRDHDGEEMMKQVKNPRLEEAPPQPAPAEKTTTRRSI